METVHIPEPTPGSFSKPPDGFRGIVGPWGLNGTTPNFTYPGFYINADDGNQAPVLLGLGGALLFISISLLAARLWSRLRPVYRLKLDDWLVLGATILAIAQYGVLTAAVLNGLGHRARFVTAPRRSTAMRLLFISQVVWYWSITLVKLSVAFLLLRLKQTRRWRSFLYLIMGITISAAIVQTCFQFLQCRPFSVYWDPRVFRSAQCFRRSIINGNIIVFSSIQVGLDVIFSFVPVTFVRKLQRPRREKIFMCVLMGLGLFASCAAVVRTMTLQEFYTSPDMFWLNVKFALWAILELQLALVAATMPTLKAFMERAVVRAGLWFYDEESEGEVRAEMVKLGLLGEGEVLARGEERGPAVGKKATKGMVGAGGGERTIGEMKEGVDTVSGGEVSFEEMLAKSAKEKEFV